MSNITPLNNSQVGNIERVAFGYEYAIPVEKGLKAAQEVIEDLGQGLVATVDSKINAELPLEAKIEEVEQLIRSATRVPAWAQAMALKKIKGWVTDVSLQGRVQETGKRLQELTTELRFVEEVTGSTERIYGAMEDFSEQVVGASAGSGEIYLDHLIALASSLPKLSKAFEIEGDFDRKWALKDVKNIHWAIDDEVRDLVKAIGPEIKRAKQEYVNVSNRCINTLHPNRVSEIFDQASRWEGAANHLKLIQRMKTQVRKLYWIADRLEGPLAETGAVLRGHAEAIERALEDLGDLSNVHYDPSVLNNVLKKSDPEDIRDIITDKLNWLKRNEGERFLSFKRFMHYVLLRGGEVPKDAIEALAKGEGLPVEGYDYKAKNVVEMRRDYLFDRMTEADRKKYKEMTSTEKEGSSWAPWLFLGLQALTMLRGAGSVLLGYDAAILKTQAEAMQKQLFDQIDPNLKVEIEKDGARLGTILSDKWDVLRKMGGGSMQDGFLHKLSPQAKEAVQALLKIQVNAPSSQQIQKICDAVISTRLAKQIPSPYHHLSISEWVSLFTKGEETKVPTFAANLLSNGKTELGALLNVPGPKVDKSVLLHVAGREFGASSGLEGNSAVNILSYVHQQLRAKLTIAPIGADRDATQTLAVKMEQAIDRTENFYQYDPNLFAQRLNLELSRLELGDNLFWMGGWTTPAYLGGHAIAYEIVKVDEDDFTFRVYNQGEGVPKHHTGVRLENKMKTLTMHEVVNIKRADLLRPSVIQGLQEMIQAPNEGKKWDPGELYYNVLGRLNGKISSRLIPIDQTLSNIYVGICSFSSLAAFMHAQLGSNRRYDRTMIELEAKAAWDYWLQNRSSLDDDREGRELLFRSAKQTIQDAIKAAKPERNSLSNGELDVVREKMEEIIRGVTRIERKRKTAEPYYQVRVQSKPSDLVFNGEKGTFGMPDNGPQVKPAPKYEDVKIQPFTGVKMAKEAAKQLHAGNLAEKWEFVRAEAHRFVQSIPLEGIEIAPDEAVAFVDNLVQIASEFQWSLQHALTKEVNRTDRVPLKDAMVLIKLLTIADSIARRFKDTVGIALPNMLQQNMAVVLYGMSAYSRVDDPVLDEDMIKIRNYWEVVDPDGKAKGLQIIDDKIDHDDQKIKASLFGLEWAQAGVEIHRNALISENVPLAKKYAKWDEEGFGSDRDWPIIQWTIDYLKAHPASLEALYAEHPFLRSATPTAIALAALMDEYDGEFPELNNPENPFTYSMPSVKRAGRIKNVLPEMFFHLWDLSFMTNYLFTGGWNGNNFDYYNMNKQDYSSATQADLMLRQRPTRQVERSEKSTDGGPLYRWQLRYKQYGHFAEDLTKIWDRHHWHSNGPTYILPGDFLTKNYGEHDESLRNVYGRTEYLWQNYKWEKGSVYRQRHPAKQRPLLKELTKEKEGMAPHLSNYHLLHDMPKETVQRLLGLSSKEDLQIEETIAFFQSNFPLLEKGEYRALLNYMLFEQGLLLDEIKKRNPTELASLIENISTLTNKGHQYYGQLLGKTDIGTFFLDIAAKTRRYLKHAGKDINLIEDPVPKLRKDLQDPLLTDKQRTYLRFLLAKSSQEPLDIVSFSIQNSIYPLDFTPFDDEIRRDLPIQLRSSIYEAFSGQSFGADLNAAIQTVLPHHNMQISWKVHGDFPLFQSSDGRITVDVLKGTYYEDGSIPRSLPVEICKNLKKEQIVLNPEELISIQTPDGTWKFSAPGGIRMMATVEGNKVWREINGQMYQRQRVNSYFGNRALMEGNHAWSNGIETLILDIKTGQLRYRLIYEGGRATVHRPDGLVMVRTDESSSFGFLNGMEDRSWTRAWADPKTGKLVSMELPRFDLSFTVDNEGKILCDQLPGYFLNPLQDHPYLVLDRIDRSQNTHQVIAMPLQSFKDSKMQALNPAAAVDQKLDSPKQRYALYDVDGMSQQLTPRPIEGRFHLAMVSLWNHDYSLAAELIRGFGGQHSRYTQEELNALDQIRTMGTHNDDLTPQGRAVRMIAHATRIRDQVDFGKGNSTFVEENDYAMYLHQLEFTPELALTKEEEHLIKKQLKIKEINSTNSTTVSSKIPPAIGSPLIIGACDRFFFGLFNPTDRLPSILRPTMSGKTFLAVYEAIEIADYRSAYQHLTGNPLPVGYSDAKGELLNALKMTIAGHSYEKANEYARVLAFALINKGAPTVEEIKKTMAETKSIGYGEPESEQRRKRAIQKQFFKRFDLRSVNAAIDFSTSSGVSGAYREPIAPREAPVEAVGYNQGLWSIPRLQGPVIENLDAFITTKPMPASKVVKTALQKIFQVKTGEPLADQYLAETVRGITEYEDSPTPQYGLRDLEGLRSLRLELEQELFLMTNRESTAVAKLLGPDGANRLPEDPTLRAQKQAAIASGNIERLTLDDLALSLINRASVLDHKQETVEILIHATERQRKQAVVEAIKDLESAPPEEISNLIGQLKAASEAVRHFDPAKRPEYLVFEYYIGILLQERQVQALDELLEKIKSGQGIHRKEISNVLEMIMGSGKTAVLAPLIAWLEANGEQISMIVMPEGLMPEKIQELEQRFGTAFGRSIDVLTFDRDTNFDEEALIRLLERLDEARDLGKLVMVSSSSLQSLFLRFIEDVLTKSELHTVDLLRGILNKKINLDDLLAGKWSDPVAQRLDLFRQVLAKLRTHGSILFDELDAIADVLKLQIFSMATPGTDKERLPANTELKETTADLIKFMVSDQMLAPIVAKPFTPEVHERLIKPRLLEAIMDGKIGYEKSELNRFIKENKNPARSWFFSTPEAKTLIRNYLLNKEDLDAFAMVANLESMTLKNTLATLKQQINKMIPETFSKRVDEHFGLVEDSAVDPDTKLISKPLEKGSWELGSEHGTAEEGINYSLQYYLAKGVPQDFVRKEVYELRDLLLADLTSGEIEDAEKSQFFDKLMRITGGKRYPLDRIGEAEIREITDRINTKDPTLNIDLAMKYAVNPQLRVFPYQLRADAHLLFAMAMLSRGFSGTVWNWQTFDAMFKTVKLSNTEAKTLHLLQANSPQVVTIVNAQDLDGKLNQLFQGKPSVAIADVGNLFADEKGEDVAQKILEKGTWKGVPYYDEKDKLMVALPGRASEPLTTAGVSKENRAPYWKQELCTGSDIPLGTTADAVVTFGRYTMMRDLLQTVWRLRKLDKGQTVRFAVEENDRRVITETLEGLTKQKIEKLELSHLLLYAAYIQAMRIADDNHRSLGQQLRSQLIGEVLNVIVRPEVPADQMIEIIKATQDLFITKIDPNPYNLYGTRESLQPAKKVVGDELQEVLDSAPMKALRSHPVLRKYCDAVAIEKRLRETVDRMMPRMASQLNQPIDTGLRLKVKTKTKTKTETDTQTQTKTKTQVQLRAAVHKRHPELPAATIPWEKENLFNSTNLKPAPASSVRRLIPGILPANQVTVADALSYYHPIASIFDPRLLTSLNRMPIYTPEFPSKQVPFVPYDEYEDPVTTHALLIQDKGEIGLMLLDQDDASAIQDLLKKEVHPAEAPNLALINLVTDKIWRQSGEPIDLSDFHSLKAQGKLVNGMLSYTEKEQKALLEFLKGKDVKAIREWFTQIVIGNRQRSLERFSNSDLEKVFQKAIT